MREEKTFMIEDAEIAFRNFAGNASQYNNEGDRNFAVILQPEDAQRLEADGWNVKYLKPSEEGDDPTPYIQVSVGYKARPPHIVMITSKARTQVTEDLVETLDWVDIKTVDLVARAYHWEVNGKSGIKAYLKTMFLTVDEDELELKYAIANEPLEGVENG